MPKPLGTASSSMFTCTRMMGTTIIYECGFPKPLGTLILGKYTAQTPDCRGPMRTRRRRGAVYAVSSTPNHYDTTSLVSFTGSLLAGAAAAVARPCCPQASVAEQLFLQHANINLVELTLASFNSNLQPTAASRPDRWTRLRVQRVVGGSINRSGALR